eukprot:5017793-Pyramimonas_sp.AAC.1
MLPDSEDPPRIPLHVFWIRQDSFAFLWILLDFPRFHTMTMDSFGFVHTPPDLSGCIVVSWGLRRFLRISKGSCASGAVMTTTWMWLMMMTMLRMKMRWTRMLMMMMKRMTMR